MYDALEPKGGKELAHVVFEELPPYLLNKTKYTPFKQNRMK